MKISLRLPYNGPKSCSSALLFALWSEGTLGWRLQRWPSRRLWQCPPLPCQSHPVPSQAALRGQRARSLPALALPSCVALARGSVRLLSPLFYGRDRCLSCIGCPKGSSSSKLQFVILGGSELFHDGTVIVVCSLCACLMRHLATTASLFS